MQFKNQHINAKLDIQTKLKISQPTIERRFRRKRGGKMEIGKSMMTHVQSTLLVTDISNHYQNLLCLTGMKDQLLQFGQHSISISRHHDSSHAN